MAQLLVSQTTVAAGTALSMRGAHHTFQGSLAGTGVRSATVDIECSNDTTHWLVLGTLTLSDTATSDGFASAAPWAFVRANVTAISGTGAAVTVLAT